MGETGFKGECSPALAFFSRYAGPKGEFQDTEIPQVREYTPDEVAEKRCRRRVPVHGENRRGRIGLTLPGSIEPDGLSGRAGLLPIPLVYRKDPARSTGPASFPLFATRSFRG